MHIPHTHARARTHTHTFTFDSVIIYDTDAKVINESTVMLKINAFLLDVFRCCQCPVLLCCLLKRSGLPFSKACLTKNEGRKNFLCKEREG